MNEELKRKYFTRKEVANYFNISIPTLQKVIYENNLKETFITWNKNEWGHKCIRISLETLNKMEKIINK